MKQKITNIVKYKASWQTWWQGLQPKWRLLKDGTFLQKVLDTDEEWEALQRGGPNGFFIIVLAFAWWAEEAKGKNDTGLLNALDDMTWVIRRMADMPATPSQLMGVKHALEDEPDSSKKKQYVLSFFVASHTNVVNVAGGKRSEHVGHYLIPLQFSLVHGINHSMKFEKMDGTCLYLHVKEC
jgi:hypothetical protein